MRKFFIKVLLISCLITSVSIATELTDIDVRVNSLYAANKIEEAFNLLVGIEQDKRTPQQLLIMGNIMMDYGRVQDAEFMYSNAISVDPKFYRAHYNLANLYLAQDKPNMAITSYKSAIKYNKEFAPAYYNLACAYIKIGELKKAKSALHNAIFYKPSVAEYHYNLAYVYKKLGKDKDAKLYLGYYNKIVNNY